MIFSFNLIDEKLLYNVPLEPPSPPHPSPLDPQQNARLGSLCCIATSYQLAFYTGLCYFRRRQWQPTPVLMPGKSHGWRSLVGCNTWGFEESDTTEWLHFHFSLSCIGEGNGNPLQCSCLEKPRDGRAWWAAVYGVAQSWTRLKWLSMLLSPFIPLSPPVSTSLFSVCVSIPSLQIGSSVPFF